MHAVEEKRPDKRVADNGSDVEVSRPASSFDWRTTDEEEIELRQQRAHEEQPRIRNLEPEWQIFSGFKVASKSGMTYRVELRSLGNRLFSCSCTDFRVNGLGLIVNDQSLTPGANSRIGEPFSRTGSIVT